MFAYSDTGAKDPVSFLDYNVNYTPDGFNTLSVTGKTDSLGWDTITITGADPKRLQTIKVKAQCRISKNWVSLGHSVVPKKSGDTLRELVVIHCDRKTKDYAKFSLDSSKTTKTSVYLIDSSFVFRGRVHYYWDFGDGNTSTQKHPKHTFSSNGSYKVCLTTIALGVDSIGNLNGDTFSVDTFCTILNLDTAGGKFLQGPISLIVLPQTPIVTDISSKPVTHFNIFPNPIQGNNVSVVWPREEIGILVIYDMNGKRVLKRPFQSDGSQPVNVDVGHLNNGLFIFHIQTAHQHSSKKTSISRN